jgi:hypothetical protein
MTSNNLHNVWTKSNESAACWLGDKPNMTLMNKMVNEKPQLHAMVRDSITIARKWAEDVIAQAKVQRTSAETILGRIT